MLVLVALVMALVACVLMFLGVRDLSTAAGRTTRIAALVNEERRFDKSSPLTVWNRRFVKTRPGAWVQRQLVLSGINQPPIIVAAATISGSILLAWLLSFALAPVFAVVGLLLGGWGLRAFLAHGKEKRLEAFINQMPELARVLANATSAGLSLRTAIDMAADEVADPARSEMRRVADAMQVGSDLETALTSINDRLPSREIRVLISTLLVAARSGGSLVTSLRDIADTLETRKEVRREIKTTLAQSVLTGYLVVGIGVGMTALLNVIQPGTVEIMTHNIVGQITLVVAGLLYAVGLLLIRRITRIEP